MLLTLRLRNNMKKEWETQNGDFIAYKNLKDDHLLNIIKWIEKKAENGMAVRYGGGFSPEDFCYEEEEIEGDVVLDYYDYKGLVKEVKKRNI